MKIAQLAPLWETVPPKTYGGTELVVYSLCEQLCQQGHDVTLFASGDSRTSANLDSCVKIPMRESGTGMPCYYENLSMSNLLAKADEFDIIHNHLGFPFLPFAKLIDTPVVTTLHGAFVNKEETEIYRSNKHLPFISISHYQRKGAPFLNYISNVYNGIDIERYPFQEKPRTEKPYLLFLGRISVEKGTHHAINIAKQTDFDLVIAGKIGEADIEYYEKEIKHLIDGKKIIYVGEVGHEAKCELFKNAYATLHTVTWPEPFGLVMAESMLCGTPVLALRDGSIPEVIKHGVTGFVETTPEALLARIKEVDKIDRRACRKHVEDNFSSKKMGEEYYNTYKKLIKQKHLSSVPENKIISPINTGEM